MEMGMEMEMERNGEEEVPFYKGECRGKLNKVKFVSISPDASHSVSLLGSLPHSKAILTPCPFSHQHVAFLPFTTTVPKGYSYTRHLLTHCRALQPGFLPSIPPQKRNLCQTACMRMTFLFLEPVDACWPLSMLSSRESHPVDHAPPFTSVAPPFAATSQQVYMLHSF